MRRSIVFASEPASDRVDGYNAYWKESLVMFFNRKDKRSERRFLLTYCPPETLETEDMTITVPKHGELEWNSGYVGVTLNGYLKEAYYGKIESLVELEKST
jgi:hypothetical protein